MWVGLVRAFEVFLPLRIKNLLLRECWTFLVWIYGLGGRSLTFTRKIGRQDGLLDKGYQSESARQCSLNVFPTDTW